MLSQQTYHCHPSKTILNLSTIRLILITHLTKMSYFFNERYVNYEFCIMFEELNSNFSHADILKVIKQL